MAYVTCADGVSADYIASGQYQIEQANRSYAASASLTPMYDPKSVRPRT
jgi:hypothetical protein